MLDEANVKKFEKKRLEKEEGKWQKSIICKAVALNEKQGLDEK
jgi:hypothetical protein